MSSLTTIRSRADELRPIPGMTPARLHTILKREFRWAERDHLVIAARLVGYPRGVTPEWGRLHPVVARWQRKGKPEFPVIKTERKVVAMNYPLMTIEARNLREGDWVEGFGHAYKIGNYRTMVLVRYRKGPSENHEFFRPRQVVEVRLEDFGQTE